MAKNRAPRPVLSPAASQDVRDALRWSLRKFGAAAAARYGVLLKQAVRNVGGDPEQPGSMQRPEIMVEGARAYHISLSRARVSGIRVKDPRHFLLYRRREDGVIEVARVLHDGRDLARHLPEGYRRIGN